MGFLRYEDTGDYATAARYLQLPSGQHLELVQLAQAFRVLSPNFKGNINLLSDDPNGALAKMQFENMKSRPKLLISQNFWLRIETKIEPTAVRTGQRADNAE